jgi:thiol-disulfide isomerase/thioredoxin
MNTGLQRVRSQDLRGRPAVLVFLAGHCTHSMDTFPILQEVTATYRVEGLQVVGVVVNSGTPDDVATWVSHFEPEYDVWVYENASLGDVIGSHLVPTYLFVDANGQVKEKLVGYKESEVVNEWLGRMLAEETRVSRR